MRWSEVHDVYLCREILLIKPYQYKPNTKESGNAWSMVSDDLNAMQDPVFTTSQKSVRDRHRLLITKYKQKMRAQENPSGITDEETELDNLLENIKEEADIASETHDAQSKQKQEQLENDAKNAEDVRQKAMESFSETKKRKELGLEDLTSPKKREKRNNGSETLCYLREKYATEQELRKEELEVKKTELELQKKQHEMLMEQMAQQNRVMNTLIDKLINK